MLTETLVLNRTLKTGLLMNIFLRSVTYPGGEHCNEVVF